MKTMRRGNDLLSAWDLSLCQLPYIRALLADVAPLIKPPPSLVMRYGNNLVSNFPSIISSIMSFTKGTYRDNWYVSLFRSFRFGNGFFFPESWMIATSRSAMFLIIFLPWLEILACSINLFMLSSLIPCFIIAYNNIILSLLCSEIPWSNNTGTIALMWSLLIFSPSLSTPVAKSCSTAQSFSMCVLL